MPRRRQHHLLLRSTQAPAEFNKEGKDGEAECRAKWASFGAQGRTTFVSMGSLVRLARMDRPEEVIRWRGRASELAPAERFPWLLPVAAAGGEQRFDVNLSLLDPRATLHDRRAAIDWTVDRVHPGGMEPYPLDFGVALAVANMGCGKTVQSRSLASQLLAPLTPEAVAAAAGARDVRYLPEDPSPPPPAAEVETAALFYHRLALVFKGVAQDFARCASGAHSGIVRSLQAGGILQNAQAPPPSSPLLRAPGHFLAAPGRGARRGMMWRVQKQMPGRPHPLARCCGRLGIFQEFSSGQGWAGTGGGCGGCAQQTPVHR